VFVAPRSGAQAGLEPWLVLAQVLALVGFLGGTLVAALERRDRFPRPARVEAPALGAS
jgi:hypothetical protein